MIKIALLAISFSFMLSLAHAEETAGEKIKAGANTASRGLKKGLHRVEEAVCTAGDLKCAAKKGGNRLKEGGSKVHDTAVETKEKVD